MLWSAEKLTLRSILRRDESEPVSRDGNRYVYFDLLLAPAGTARWRQSPRPALLDTGCGAAIAMSKKLFEELDGVVTDRSQATIADGQEIEVGFGTVDVALAGLRLIAVPCAVIDSTSEDVEKEILIGVPLLDLFRLHLDKDKAVLVPQEDAIRSLLTPWKPKTWREKKGGQPHYAWPEEKT